MFNKGKFTTVNEEVKKKLELFKEQGKGCKALNKICKATVVNTEVGSLEVNWQCQTFSKDAQLSDLGQSQPSSNICGEDLKR